MAAALSLEEVIVSLDPHYNGCSGPRRGRDQATRTTLVVARVRGRGQATRTTRGVVARVRGRGCCCDFSRPSLWTFFSFPVLQAYFSPFSFPRVLIGLPRTP